MRWNIKQADPEKINALQQQLKIHPVLCRMLVQRGIETFEEAKKFFRPELIDLHDPFLMKDMDKAIHRINTAIVNNESILVFGDYDVDGTTAIATVYSFFRKFYPHIAYYVPNRYNEGYGISFKGIDYAADNNYTLVIALDCGIKANEKIDYANKKGVDFIICDHHTPGNEIPRAVAVLDPKRTDCSYPFKELSGCGVGFKLIQAYCLHHQMPSENYLCFVGLVCISISADIVPITGENRILAYYGLKKINEKPLPGIKKLMETAGAKKQMDITNVVFMLAPRINAAGRMEDAAHAVRLLIAEGEEIEAEKHADRLNELNADRKDLDKNITIHALEMIAGNPDLLNRKSTVVFHPEWHKGVIGIVASRLTETYYRPTIVLTQSEGKVTGSARSVKNFDLYEAIYECKDLLLQFGGHKYAAGLTMLPENVEAFRNKFDEVVSKRITPEQLIPEIDIDAEIELNDVNQGFYSIIQQMAPFGPENMRPVFITKQVKDSGWSKVVKEEHIKFSVNKNGNQNIEGIGFRLAQKFDKVKAGSFNIAYQIDENEYNGNIKLQMLVKDIA